MTEEKSNRPPPRRPAKMVDIAERSGVAVSTVSYALSGKKPVSADTQARIDRAIEELQFRPHAPAQALKRRSTRTIELFFPAAEESLESPIFLAGAVQATSEADYSLLVSTAVQDPSAVTAVQGTGRADGVILMEVHQHDERVERLRDSGLPFSLIGRCASNEDLSYVDFDFADAVRQAAIHLHGLGHRHIVLIDEAPSRAGHDYGPTIAMQEAFETISGDLDFEGEQLLCGTAGEHDLQVLRYLERTPSCTAAITISATVTPLLSVMADVGMRMPDDMDVVCILAPQVALFVPPQLTTIDLPAMQMGRLGAETLIRQLTDRDAPPDQILLRGTLQVGRDRRGR